MNRWLYDEGFAARLQQSMNFREELRCLTQLRVVIALGKIAFGQYCHLAGVTPIPKFAHNAVYPLKPVLIGSYHPSRQNTNTGKLTEPMFDAVFAHAKSLLGFF